MPSCEDPEAWARFVSSDSYQISHLLGGTGGTILAILGNLLLGTAVWHSRVLPRWAGALFSAGAVLFFVLGVVLGQATTGSSLPTQSLGGLLMAIAAAWVAWKAPGTTAMVPGETARPGG